MLSIGLMSGTSMDGIDAALIETDGESQIKELSSISLNYSDEFKILLKAAELAVRHMAGDLSAAKKYYPQAITDYLNKELNLSSTHELMTTNFDTVVEKSTRLHIQLVKQLLAKTNYSSEQIDVIGYHGQTLFHHPAKKITIQVGDGQLLADETRIKVVNDFRKHDVAAGGQGAPLAPLYHQAIAIRDQKIPLVIVNCGGIANVTVITDEATENLIGFDTGPGNGLIDRYVKQKTAGKECMDTDGKYGIKGKINEAALKKLHEKLNSFLSLKPPKSLDIGDFKLIPELNNLSIEDGCATLEAFTADTIVKSIDHIANNIPKLWVLAGGGWNNPVIYSELKTRLWKTLDKDIEIKMADEIGWNSKYMEAQIFAYLAVCCLQHKPISFPSTTQVPYPLSGGLISHPAH